MKPRFASRFRGCLAFLLLFGGVLACQPAPLPCATAADCKNRSAPACFQGRCQAASCTSDLDCSNPAQPSCQAGSCQPRKTACQGPLDCNDPQRPVCSQGVCQPRPSECSNDSDCPNERFFCQQGVCWLRSLPCGSDTDCKEPAPRCLQGMCLPPSACQKDGDCKDSQRPVCLKGVCRSECASNHDCPDGAKPLCDQGRCQPHLPECFSHIDCKEAARSRCTEGRCQPECSRHADCKDLLLPACLEGRCQPEPPECTQSADCKQPERPRCVQTICQPPLEPCETDQDCTHPVRPRCQDNACSSLPCTKNEDCTDATTPLCRERRCSPHSSECMEDSDCLRPSKRYCVGLVCQARPFSCTSDADCRVSQTPLCEAGTCKARIGACTRDADCKDISAPRCWRETCGPLCRSDDDCKALNAVCQQGRCSLCSTDLDCPAPLLCDRSVCVQSLPSFCATDADCQQTGFLAVRCLSGRCLRLRSLESPSPIHQTATSVSTPFPAAPYQELRDQHSRSVARENGAVQNVLAKTAWFDAGHRLLAGQSLCHLMRWNAEGKLLWEKEAIHTGSVDQTACDSQLHSNEDSFWLKPQASKDAGSLAVERLDLQGNTLWEASFFPQKSPPAPLEYLPNAESPTMLRLFPTGESLIAFGSGLFEIPTPHLLGRWKLFPSEKRKPFLLKLDSAGRPVWIRFLPHPFVQVEIDKKGFLYVLGVLKNKQWEGQVLPYQGETDIYVAKLDVQGRLVWVNSFGGLYLDCPGGLRVFEDSSVVISAELHTSACPVGLFVCFRAATSKVAESLPSQEKTSFGQWELEHPKETKNIHLLASLDGQGRWQWARVHSMSEEKLPPSIHRFPSSRWLVASGHEEWQEWNLRGQKTWTAFDPLLLKNSLDWMYPPSFFSLSLLPLFYGKSDQYTRSLLGKELPPFFLESSSGFRVIAPRLSLDLAGGLP